MSSPRPILPVVLASILLLCSIGGAQAPQVGDPAPPFELKDWLSLGELTPPTNDGLVGKVVMIEFWGGWCGPCMRAMPKVQSLHDKFREKDLVVLAITYETPDVVSPVLDKQGWTMIVGSDPEKKVIGSYGVKSWPTTFVIGKDGRVAYVGSPYGAEQAVESALGLESSPAVLLTAWLEILAGSDREAQRSALERLNEKATSDFDLRGWARAQGGETAETAAATDLDGSKALDRCCAVWKKNGNGRQELLDDLANAAPESFDLSSWVTETFGKTYPLTSREMKELLARQQWDMAIDAIANRRPKGSVVAIAVKDKSLREHCKKRFPECRNFAKKAIMALHWPMQQRVPKDNEAFWAEISVSGMSMSEDRKSITGVMIGGELVTRSAAPRWIHDRLAAAIIMEAFAEESAPALRTLDKQVEKEHQKILAPLEQQYGASE